MDATAVLQQLAAKGKPNTIQIYRRHGVEGPCCGVSYADIGKLVKQIGTDHAMALALWRSGVHEARVVATKIVDPAALTRQQADRWARSLRDYVLAHAVAGCVARLPFGRELALEWTDDAKEHVAEAGWSTLSVLAMDDGIDDRLAARLIARIERDIHGALNRVRYAMYGCLISIGGSMASLRDAALQAARRIGKVEVDHGETGCKTPDAVTYILKMADRGAARRTRVTGARMARAAAPKPGAKRPAAKSAAAKPAAAKSAGAAKPRARRRSS